MLAPFLMLSGCAAAGAAAGAATGAGSAAPVVLPIIAAVVLWMKLHHPAADLLTADPAATWVFAGQVVAAIVTIWTLCSKVSKDTKKENDRGPT